MVITAREIFQINFMYEMMIMIMMMMKVVVVVTFFHISIWLLVPVRYVRPTLCKENNGDDEGGSGGDRALSLLYYY